MKKFSSLYLSSQILVLHLSLLTIPSYNRNWNIWLALKEPHLTALSPIYQIDLSLYMLMMYSPSIQKLDTEFNKALYLD